jgi:hypothetical protein
MRYQAHSLGAVDPTSRTAICSDCGFVHVKYEKQPSGNYEWRCALTCKASYQGQRSLRNRSVPSQPSLTRLGRSYSEARKVRCRSISISVGF